MAREFGFGIIFGVVIRCSKTYPEHSFLLQEIEMKLWRII